MKKRLFAFLPLGVLVAVYASNLRLDGGSDLGRVQQPGTAIMPPAQLPGSVPSPAGSPRPSERGGVVPCPEGEVLPDGICRPRPTEPEVQNKSTGALAPGGRLAPDASVPSESSALEPFGTTRQEPGVAGIAAGDTQGLSTNETGMADPAVGGNSPYKDGKRPMPEINQPKEADD